MHRTGGRVQEAIGTRLEQQFSSPPPDRDSEIPKPQPVSHPYLQPQGQSVATALRR